MSASKYIKNQGLPSLIYVAGRAGVTRQLLHRWYIDKPKLFEIIVRGCVKEMKEEER